MPRLLYPWLLLLLAGCEANWTTLADTEAASQRVAAPTASEEQPEIPEQDARSDWLKGKVVHIVDGDTLDLACSICRVFPRFSTFSQAHFRSVTGGKILPACRARVLRLGG
jgi:hypothetical protein